MSLITEEQPPSETEDNLAEYLVRMFRDAATSDDISDQFYVRTELPDKPITGKLYYFEQIPNTTIYREGFYWYVSETQTWEYMGVSDFYYDVAAGLILGKSPVSVIGHDSLIGTNLATVGNSTGILHTYSTTADIDSISSDNAGDTHDITIYGLDIDYNPVTPFTVTLNGQSRVAFPTSLFRIDEVVNETAIATLGAIWVYRNTAIAAGKPIDLTAIVASIHRTPSGVGTVSNEHHTNSVKTIPAGKRAFVVFGKTTVSDAKAMSLSFWVKEAGGVAHLVHPITLKNNNYDYFFKLPAAISEKSDLEVRCSVDSGTAEVSVAYDLIFEDIIQ